MAATARGLCAVLPGDDDTFLEREFLRDFPYARKAEVSWRREVREAFCGIPEALPLDLIGTAFQKRVWHALCEIPRGKTRTYTEVAVSVGRPKAARAVASACAANRLTILVPCHRVIHRNGELGGYAWGRDRKAQLLRAEGFDIHPVSRLARVNVSTLTS